MASQGRTRAPEDDAFLELPRKMNHIGGSAPCIDASESDGIVWLTAEVPGIPETEIDISLSGDILTITIDKQNRNAGKRVFFSERSYGQFESTGVRPNFMDRLEAAGVRLPSSAFRQRVMLED